MNPKDYVLRGKDYLTSMPYNDWRLKKLTDTERMLMPDTDEMPSTYDIEVYSQRMRGLIKFLRSDKDTENKK